MSSLTLNMQVTDILANLNSAQHEAVTAPLCNQLILFTATYLNEYSFDHCYLIARFAVQMEFFVTNSSICLQQFSLKLRRAFLKIAFELLQFPFPLQELLQAHLQREHR